MSESDPYDVEVACTNWDGSCEITRHSDGRRATVRPEHVPAYLIKELKLTFNARVSIFVTNDALPRLKLADLRFQTLNIAVLGLKPIEEGR